MLRARGQLEHQQALHLLLCHPQQTVAGAKLKHRVQGFIRVLRAVLGHQLLDRHSCTASLSYALVTRQAA